MPNVQDRKYFIDQAAVKLEDVIGRLPRHCAEYSDHDRDVSALIAVLRDVLRALRAPV